MPEGMQRKISYEDDNTGTQMVKRATNFPTSGLHSYWVPPDNYIILHECQWE